MSEPLLPTDPASIGGHRLLARLGAGGMGVVYLGRTESGALAAVKVIQAEYADDPGFRARFRREVDLARRVSSPWAVPVTGAEPEAAEPWLATVFVPGPSLGEAVARHGPLPVRSVRALARMLAGALGAVHAAGLVHRDVKPGNVLLAVDGPRLIDFGIARATDETALTSTDMVVGTPGYLSPEQAEARGAGVGPASDVFSLGCLLAYALTGRPPFGGGTADALLYRTVHDEPDIGADGADGAWGERDPELRRLLLSCLAKDPAARPTAGRIAAELAGDATPEDAEGGGGGADWLPEDVVRGIAGRAAEMLALPDIEPTAAGGPAPESGEPVTVVTGADDSGQRPSRRRLFALTGGALLAVAAGGGAWAALRDDDSRNGEDTGPRWAIGVQADLSGKSRAAGQAQERGARLAIERYNAREPGKDRPFALALRTADDGGTARRAPDAAEKLIGDPDVLAVIGPTSDAAAEAVMGAYDEALLPVLTVSAGGMMMTRGQPRSLVHCRPGDAALSVPIAVHLAQLAAKDKEMGRTGLLQDRTAQTYAWESATITSLLLRDSGMPAYPRVIPAGVEDMKPVVTDILKAGTGSFVYAGYAPGAAKVARELAAAGFDGPRLASQAVLDPEFLRLAGDAAEGWLLTASFVSAADTPEAADFTAAYRERFGTAPPYYAAEAYDAVNLVVQELVKGAKPAAAAKENESPSPSGQQPPKRAELVGLLRKSTYRGTTKRFAFDAERGSFAGDGVFLYEVRDGGFRFLGPAPTGA
ncbi:bifunctional serine/threonine-protein kinase/ABC transporter substrate-binding protein [Streptomyces sp. NP-1717]|uniref:bifunctional serine/threonine-protein kinase/ABC transporter substrate-binding protein n=1 Tax=Streptomyces sp. NP-1717 TaxID=2704470 RepID=UPI001F5D0AC6|nr:bifunctional serine/threonine-protein kinase/ABC transporter substrate-binding protein [Streptomyces sp. NP-1717]MCI3221541.1 ABC transporter substrate-binding protein [Streptomyces sp. NP-1717]